MENVKLEPYMWLESKKCEFKAKITCVMPAGGLKNYAEYELLFENGHKLVLKQEIIDMLFAYTGIQGDFHRTFEETMKELRKNTKKEEPKSDERAELVKKAKELGIKSPHLIKDLNKLREKVLQAQ